MPNRQLLWSSDAVSPRLSPRVGEVPRKGVQYAGLGIGLQDASHVELDAPHTRESLDPLQTGVALFTRS